MGFSLKLNGREVRNPFLRVPLGILIGIWGLMMLVIGFAWTLFAVAFSIAFLPFALLLHPCFRVLGCRGFFYRKKSNVFTYSIGTGSFRRA
jgi:hypothetical protein